MAITNLTNAQRGSLVELYIAYFNRAPEAAGLEYWVQTLLTKLNSGQTEAQAFTDISNQFYEAGVAFSAQTGYSATMTDAAFITKIYENVLGRTGGNAPSFAEVDYWVKAIHNENPFETGVTRFTLIQRMLNDAKSFTNDPTWGWVAELLDNKVAVASYFSSWSVSGSYTGEQAVLEGKAALAGVTSNPATVADAISNLEGNSGTTFTLKEAIAEGESGTPPVTAIYWGYTPNYSEVGEGTGVPVEAMLSFLTTITGLDLHELGLIDDDGVGPFDNVTHLEIEFGDMSDVSVAGNGTLIIGFDNGSSVNAEVELGAEYFNFLNNLLFDEDGYSRLYEKVIEEGSSGSDDHMVPIVLTPIVNNGGTYETGNTTTSDDTIVAGRLDLLHGAYIDGGNGYNVLEVDAKGAYAQPVQLLNIQEVRVSDQPNFYTDYYGNDGYLDDSTYPYPVGSGSDDSWLDLSRATRIQRLVVTDQGGDGHSNYDSDIDNYSGTLTIVGVRNGATLRLEGAFVSGTTNIHYGQGLGGSLTVELALGDVTEDINILQNASVLNVVSTGIENHMHSFFAGGSISRMIVSGPAKFSVDEDLYTSFNAGSQAIVDASTNTGGIDIILNGHSNVRITGTVTDDEIISSGSAAFDSGSGTLAGGGRAVVIANNGDNLVDVRGRSIASVTSGTGNDTINAHASDVVTITAGDGANLITTTSSRIATITTGTGNDVINASPGNFINAAVTVTAGDGNNTITANGSSTTSDIGYGLQRVTITSGVGNDTITSRFVGNANIDAGAGTNTITVIAADATINTGAGNDTVSLAGVNSSYDDGDLTEGSGSGTDGNNTGNGGHNPDQGGTSSHFNDDLAPGVRATINLGEGSNTLNLGVDIRSAGSGSITSQTGVSLLEGSVITTTGTGTIRLFVENMADVTLADMTGATFSAVVLKQELRMTYAQFLAIGAAKFSVINDEQGATEDLYLVVSSDTTLGDLSALPASVRLHIEIQNGATLTLTAEQLHEHFAVDGIDVTDGLNGKVKITGAGTNFDAFDNAVGGEPTQTIPGGTLSDSFFGSQDVTIVRSRNGFDRPETEDNTDTIVLDSTGAATLVITDDIDLGMLVDNPTTLQIIGNQDIMFDGAVINLGNYGNRIDFTELDGTITGMVIDNFENLAFFDSGSGGMFDVDGGVFGNNTGTRIDVILRGDVGSNAQGLVSEGVAGYMVIDMFSGSSDATARTIWLCDDTKDLEYIGMHGLGGHTLTINNVPWGEVHPSILLEGDGYADWNSVGNVKADGHPNQSNIGTVVVEYFVNGAPAVVNINNGGTELGVASTGDERFFLVDGINLTNAISLELNITEGDAQITSLVSDSNLTSLDIDATEDVMIGGDLPASLEEVDTSGVVGTFDASIAPAGDFSFVGGAGGSELTITDDIDSTEDDISFDGGAGGLDLVIDDEIEVDLTEAELIAIDSIFVGDDATLVITIDQALEIGPENITTDGATLVLSGLGEQEFSLGDFDQDFDFVMGITVIEGQTTVTLHPNTDLTGISGLIVPEGVTLVMTAAQFQQLTGAGTIEGEDGTEDFNVVITGLTQADAEFDEDGDGDSDGLDLGDITGNVTLQVAQDVVLDDDDDLDSADVELADGVMLSLYLDQADGLTITGATSVLKFLDTSTVGGPFHDTFDASGWSVSAVMLLNIAVADRNVDFLLAGIQEGVEKIIYNGVGMVDGVTQTVTITAETTVAGFLAFNPFEDEVEIENFILNLEGGTEISDDLILATTDKEDAQGNDLIRTYLQTVVINSTGTVEENIFSGETANVITGDITPYGLHPLAIANELLDVTINASQDFVVEGEIIFESEDGEDEFAGNDDDEAVAEVLVTGTADVEFGIDTDDNDVDGLIVTNSGTGTTTVRIDEDNIDDEDELAFVGTGDIDLVVENGSEIDFSDDDLSAVDDVTLEGDATITVTLAQYLAIGAANFLPDDDDGTTGTINIVGVGSAPFDATGVNDGIVIGTITMAPGSNTLDPTTNLTGVMEIIVPEGGTLTLTATQYQQLFGSGTISGVEPDGDPTGNFTVNITGLTQALVDHNETVANGDGDGFDISGIMADTKTITLGEATVELTEGTTVLDDVSELEFMLTAGQELIFTHVNQVSPVSDDVFSEPGTGITVTGGAGTTATFWFSDLDNLDEMGSPTGFDGDDTIDASGINVATLKLLNTLVDNRDVELLQNIGEEVIVVIFSPADNPGNVAGIDRVVIVEPDVTVAGFLVFNDYQPTSEIRTLDITLQGDGADAGTVGAVIDGNLRLTTTAKDPDLTQFFLDSVTIRSTGTGTNMINGDVSPLVTVGNTIDGVANIDNELLALNVVATTDIEINGDAIFNSLGNDGDDDTATFTASGTADITLDHIDISEDDANNSSGSDEIGTLVIANNLVGGTLTVVGGSHAIVGSSAFESLIITGTGATVLGVDPNYGISSSSLSVINASGSSGALTIEAMQNIDSQNFVFTSGTGVTMVELDNDELDEDVTADTGWTFNFTNAAVGSELHLGSEIDYWEGQLTFNMGPNGTLYIDNTSGMPTTVDLSDSEVFLTYTGAQAIVLGDGVTLILRADQADGLNIVAGDNTDVDMDDDFTGIVNIVELENDEVYDFSGIIPAGTITLAENDVTVEPGTDLGTFSVTLLDLDGDSSSLDGQTIRFSTEAQATRDIIVDDNGQGTALDSSTNVVWLFDSIAAVGGIDTSGYDPELGRLWFFADLIANEGGDIEQLFTTLPSTILRVDIESLAELNILLQSEAVNRVMEIVHFVTVGNLTFSDMGIDPEEHLESLTLHLGGQTTVGSILVNDVVGDVLNTDLSNIDFDFLTLVSHRAVRTGDLLASELFVNNNDGIVDPVGSGAENVQPDNINTVGNIGVGAGNSGIDLVLVNIDTMGITVLGDSSAGDGAAITTGTITFGYTDQDGAGSDPATTDVELDVTGDNDINIAAVIATDVDITAVNVDATGFTAVLTAPGTSPGVQLGTSVEELSFENDNVESDGDAEFEVDSEGSLDGDEELTIHYTLNGVAGSVTVDGNDVDLTDDNAIAAYLAAELDDLDGVTASSAGDIVTIARDDLDPAGPADFALAGVEVGGSADSLNAFVNDVTTNDGGTIILGTADNAGVAGANLSEIDATEFDGTLNLGTIIVDSTNDDSVPGGVNDGLLPAFTFMGGSGETDITLGMEDGQVSTLMTGSEWIFDYSGVFNADPQKWGASSLTITEDAVLQDGAILTLINVPLVIEGDVDLTDVILQPSGDGATIWIPAGSTLTLDVDQLDDGFVRIYGSGTLRLVGDASNMVIGGNNGYVGGDGITEIEALNLDLSDVIIVTDDLAMDDDGDDTVEVDLSMSIATDDDGNAAGYTVTGTDFDDSITGSSGNDSLMGGLGNDLLIGGLFPDDADTLDGGAGTFNLLVDGLGDTTFMSTGGGTSFANGGMDDGVNTGDTLIVTAGSTLNAEVESTPGLEEAGFEAGDDSTNAGTLNVTAEDGAPTLIDMSAVGGTVGYLIVGADTDGAAMNSGDGVNGGDTLTGGAFNDTIQGGAQDSGGNSLETSGGADNLTGGAGNDVFEFFTQTTDPLDITFDTSTDGADNAVITVSGWEMAGDDNDNESLTLLFTVNNTETQVTVTNTAVDFEDPNSIATALAAALEAHPTLAGLYAATATGSGDVIVLSAPGARFDVDGYSANNAAAVALTIDETPAGAEIDVAQVTDVTVPNGTVTAGELYDLRVTRADGIVMDIDAYEVQGGDDYLDVVAGLVANFNASALAGTINAVDNMDGTLTLTDEDADDGGFTVTFAFGTGSFGGSSASDGTNSATADLITDFDQAGNDVIDLNLVAGTSANFEGGGEEASFMDALNAAQAEFTGDMDLVYFFNWIADDEDTDAVDDQIGLLFFDGNDDGVIDGMLKLAGVTDFDANDIIA